jgi:2-polyprenyl-6-methoxyphenol hydroxylase-like FAD-dependent oxidoreductase
MESRVLIVGAGPVGLSLALELGKRGVEVVILEEKERAGAQPRAKTTNIRSMAHFRRWGLADAVRGAAPLASDYPRNIVFATRLFGYELARFPNAFFGEQQLRDERFPEPAQWIPQYGIERVLRDAIGGLPNVSLRFGHRVIDVRQHTDRIEAEIAQGDTRMKLSAQYLVGADGGRSAVRKALDIPMEGDHAYMNNFLAIYRAPGLSERVPLSPAISYWLVNADAPAVTGPMDRGDTWFFSTQLKDGAEPYDPHEARRRIRSAIGANVEFNIIETDTWSAHRLLAHRYRVGRAFLAGDACHLHPPMGGYGMNMGIGDAVDLGWKLAAALQGWGGETLLDSYEAERRPVARRVIEEASSNYSFVTHHMVRDRIENEDAAGMEARRLLGAAILKDKDREFHAIGVVLGTSYSGSPVIIPDGTPELPWDPMEYIADARPGNIAPHCWLADGRSLYDLLGQGFTLLATTEDAMRLAAPLIEAAKQRGFPLALATPNVGRFRELYGASLVLIRPDQHIAWRGDALDRAPELLLDHVSGRAARRVCEELPT